MKMYNEKMKEYQVFSFDYRVYVFVHASLLPVHTSEQGNVIGSVRIYMCVQKNGN